MDILLIDALVELVTRIVEGDNKDKAKATFISRLETAKADAEAASTTQEEPAKEA